MRREISSRTQAEIRECARTRAHTHTTMACCSGHNIMCYVILSSHRNRQINPVSHPVRPNRSRVVGVLVINNKRASNVILHGERVPVYARNGARKSFRRRVRLNNVMTCARIGPEYLVLTRNVRFHNETHECSCKKCARLAAFMRPRNNNDKKKKKIKWNTRINYFLYDPRQSAPRRTNAARATVWTFKSLIIIAADV